MPSSSDTAPRTIITTHQNADFDAFAAAVAASRLYPEARIVFSGSLNPNVREFVALHGDRLPLTPLRSLVRDAIQRLVMVDTAECDRLGELGDLCSRPGVEVIVFDHHRLEGVVRPAFISGENWVVSSDGAQATSMLHILLERGFPISPLEATIFALGIHEDTGSLTYPRTTVRDAEMLAVCMRLGASLPLIEHFLHSSLTDEQRELFMLLIDSVRMVTVRGQPVHVVTLETPQYVDGLSVLAHKLMDLLNSEVLLQAVRMEDRVFVTARSKSDSVDVGALLGVLGGGGHAQAASAVVRDGTADQAAERLLRAFGEMGARSPRAADIMSRPVRFVDAETSVADALAVAQQYGHSGISVKERGQVVGIVARRDLDKAMHHGLSHAPVKGVMTRNLVFARESSTIDELRELIVETRVGRLPIVSDSAYERARQEATVSVEDVRGIATRTDVLAAYQGAWDEEAPSMSPARVSIPGSLADLPFLGRIFQAAALLSEDYAGVYLVGGLVRDLLLGRPNADVDIAIEGSGIEFAHRLAEELGGRVRAHEKFQTAVVLLPPEATAEAPAWLLPAHEPFHIDVATTRTEFYEYPAALPRVEHASIRQDLFRRDFTINAMAVSLKGEHFGAVLDFFGGLRDLDRRIVRVLHNLSFIEDPTRIFRAIRYENRYGFRMDEQTRALARGCVDMHLVGDLSSARLRDELVAILSERDVEWSLLRLHELGVAKQVHPKLATGERTVELVRRLTGLVRELGLGDEVLTWRLRLAAIARNMSHEELFIWLEKLKLKHSDAEVVRKSVVLGPRVIEQLADPALSDWEVFELLSRIPTESTVLSLARSEDEVAARLRDYVTRLRMRRPALTGADILALGARQGPEVGRVLRELQRLRVEGRVETREQELSAAGRLVGAHRG
jgi:tRNA nucleotidyltransferase (CCA-adding enzyme)